MADRRAADGRGGTKAAADAAGRPHARPAERKDSIVHAALQERREPIEPLSVQGALRDAGEPDMAEYLIGCMRFAVSGASAGHYIARLRGLFRARSAYAMASDFCRRLTEGEDVDACTDALRTALRGLDAPSGRIVRMDELASGVYDDVERRSRGEMTGILTGIPDLDRLIFCLEPGDLAVIGARPAVGKSAFGMQIALNAARQDGMCWCAAAKCVRCSTRTASPPTFRASTAPGCAEGRCRRRNGASWPGAAGRWAACRWRSPLTAPRWRSCACRPSGKRN